MRQSFLYVCGLAFALLIAAIVLLVRPAGLFGRAT